MRNAMLTLACIILATTACSTAPTAPIESAPPKVQKALDETRHEVEDTLRTIRALDDAGCNMSEFSKSRRGDIAVKCK